MPAEATWPAAPAGLCDQFLYHRVDPVLSIIATVTMPLSPRGELWYLTFRADLAAGDFLGGRNRFRRSVSPCCRWKGIFTLRSHESLTDIPGSGATLHKRS